MTGEQLASLLMAGLSATGGQFSITAAYSHAPASEISVYDYIQIIFAAILGMIFLNEMPDLFSIIGYVIIITAGVVMFFYEGILASLDIQTLKIMDTGSQLAAF